MQANQQVIIAAGMEAKLYRAARSGSIKALREIADWMDQETPAGNNVLHLHVEKSTLFKKASRRSKKMDDAAIIMNDEFIKNILNDDDGYWLLWKQNISGETPLHLAAKFGYSAAVEAFIERAKQGYQPADGVTRLLCLTNNNADTALHVAARAGHDLVVRLLVQADPTCHNHALPNAVQETPLYLAAESGSTPSVISILMESPDDPSPILAFQGPCGRTPLHAAVQWGDSEMVKNILSRGRMLIRIPDAEGLTPLHSAAGEVYKVELLKMLLDSEKEPNYSAVYIRDKMGRTPLHIAVLRKNWKAIHNLIKSRPDCIEIVDNEGQNVLHYAAKWSHFRFVRILLWRYSVVRKLIYAKDVNGNTPFHLLAASLNKESSNKSDLFRLPMFVRNNPSINLKAFNNQNLTVGDMLISCDSLLRQERMLRGDNAKELYRGRRITAYEKDVELEKATYYNEYGERNIRSIKKAAQSRLVVAALIATVSFTAGFTIPGGLDQNAGKNMGMAVFRSKFFFGVFLISDAIAFICSTLAILFYFMLVSVDANRTIRGLSAFGMMLNTVSLGALMIAFLSAVSAILPKTSALVYSTYAISAVFFNTYLALVVRTWVTIKKTIWHPQRHHNLRLLY